MTGLADFLAPIASFAAGDLGGEEAVQGAVRKETRNMGMTCQEENEWCWAAVTQSVERWKGADHDQSSIASRHVSRDAEGLVCQHPLATGDSGATCTGCGGQGCGDPHSLGVVLQERGAMDAGGSVAQPPKFSDIKQAIDAGKPMPVRIAWDEDNGHFIYVAGYSIDTSGTPWLTLFDPLVPAVAAGPADRQEVRFATFSTAYGSTGGATGSPNYYYELA